MEKKQKLHDEPLSYVYMIQFKHTLYHAVVIRGQTEGQNHDQFLQSVHEMICYVGQNSKFRSEIATFMPPFDSKLK